MSALSELLDKDNWSNFAWYGERSLSLEVVPELEQEFNKLLAALEEKNGRLTMMCIIERQLTGKLAAKDAALEQMRQYFKQINDALYPYPHTISQIEFGDICDKVDAAWLSAHPAPQGDNNG